MWVKDGPSFEAGRTGKNEHLVSTYCVPVPFHVLPHSCRTTQPQAAHSHFAENDE